MRPQHQHPLSALLPPLAPVKVSTLAHTDAKLLGAIPCRYPHEYHHEHEYEREHDDQKDSYDHVTNATECSGGGGNDDTQHITLSRTLRKPQLTLQIATSPINSPRDSKPRALAINDAQSQSLHPQIPSPNERRFSYPPGAGISQLTPASQMSFFAMLEKRRAYQPRRGLDLTLKSSRWFRVRFSVCAVELPAQLVNHSASVTIHVYEMDALNAQMNLIGVVSGEDERVVAWQSQTADCTLLLQVYSDSQALIGVASMNLEWLIETRDRHTTPLHHPADVHANQQLIVHHAALTFRLTQLECFEHAEDLQHYTGESAALLAARQSQS